MNQAFDPLNLILLAIALVVFWRLRAVLGSRTGNERPPLDPFGGRTKGRPEDAAVTSGKKVLQFPTDGDRKSAPSELEGEPDGPAWGGHASPGSSVASGFDRIAQIDSQFDPGEFLTGARIAYEMIVEAFAKGDRDTLKSLLSREVYEGFAKAIDARQIDGKSLTTKFVGIEKTEFLDAGVVGRRATLTLKIVSQLISATLSKAGEVLEGDPKQIQEITDVWTFERDLSSRDPNWRVVATEEPV